MEQSLVLVKPDAVKRGLSGAIIARFEERNLKLIGLKLMHMSPALAEHHYAVHRDKPFFPGLIAYITSGPIVAAVFEGEEAVLRIRQIMGATNPAKAEPGTIRRDFGLDLEQNSVHGSDSPENATKEIELFFAGCDLVNYARG